MYLLFSTLQFFSLLICVWICVCVCVCIYIAICISTIYLAKQRHCFTNKGPSSQGYGFSSSHVWMWEWTIKKAEHWRIDAFELWCWRRLLRVPWTARRSNQSILKEISPEYSLVGLMPMVKLKYFGHLMWRTDSFKRPWCWERLKAGGEGDDREWDGWMASPTHWTWVWVTPGVGDEQGGLAYCSPWGCRVRHDWVTKLNWAEASIHLSITKI